MPDKEDLYISESESICVADYRDLALSRELLHSVAKKTVSTTNHIEDGCTSPYHTAFPVDLKEVFELTNPNSEIHQTILRSAADLNPIALQYSIPNTLIHSSKGIVDNVENGVTWHHVLRDQVQHTDQIIHASRLLEDHGQSDEPLWEENIVDDPPQSYSDDVADDLMQKSPLPLISGHEAVWTHVIKQPDTTTKHLEIDKNQMHGVWSHVLDDIPCVRDFSNTAELMHPHQVPIPMLSGHKPWDIVRHPTESDDLCDMPPIDLSDCTKLSQLDTGHKDVSCQVDEMSGQHSPNEHNDIPNSPVEENDPKMVNMSIDNEHSDENDRDFIKPEMYMEEHHLVVQAGSKVLVKAKTDDCFMCVHCKKTFPDGRSLQRHSQIHVGVKQYRCNICDKTFLLIGDLKRHQRVHSGEKPYSCEMCGRRFTLKGNLMQHFRTHVPEKQYACTICKRNYSQKDSLQRHIRAHFNEKPYECLMCPKKFTLKGDLSRHTLVHSGTKPHCCKYCGRLFALKGNLTQHFRTHTKSHGKNVLQENGDSTTFNKCQNDTSLICDLSYSHVKPFDPSTQKSQLLGQKDTYSNHSSSLSTYVQSSPSDTDGLSFCSECSKTFPSPESLHDHVQLIHEQSTRIAVNRYMCNICKKEFSLKGDLTRHLNSHNGVKPYECGHCSKTFTLKSNLRQHIATHQTGKYYSCQLCSKTFGNKRNLNLHVRRHEQARANFTCTKCGRAFLAKSDHFFHNCQKEDVPSTDRQTVPPLSSLSRADSPIIDNDCPPTVNGESDIANPSNFLTVLSVKHESSKLICDEAESPDEGLDDGEPSSLTVNSQQSFLGPFYRHLYFSSSHQNVLPSLKGLFQTPDCESDIEDFSRLAKPS